MDAEDARRLAERIETACRDEPGIVAVLLYGSRVAGNADRYSDLDVGVVAADTALEDVVGRLDGLVAAVGRPLFNESFGDRGQRHVIFADGSTLELIVTAEGELRIDGPHRVLYDRTGAVAAAAVRRPAGPVGADTGQEHARELIVWFWHDVEHLVTALARGQTWWAYGQLDELRRVCLNIARLAKGGAIEPSEAYWKVDQALAADTLAAVARTVAPLEARAIAGAAIALVAVYRDLARPLAAATGLAYPDDLDRLVSSQLEDVAEDRGGRR